jgi:hypothetical protein
MRPLAHSALAAAIAAAAAPPATAALITLYDLSDPAERLAWEEAIAAKIACPRQSFADFDDWRSTPMEGPLDAASDNDLFDPGDIVADYAFDANVVPFGVGGPAGRGPGVFGLLASGPDGGGYPQNTLTPYDVADGLDILSPDDAMRKCSFELTLAGAGLMTISVYTDDQSAPAASFSITASLAGSDWGIAAMEDITRINLYDPLGHEGIAALRGYRVQIVPGPASLAALVIGAMVARRRRATAPRR